MDIIFSFFSNLAYYRTRIYDIMRYYIRLLAVLFFILSVSLTFAQPRRVVNMDHDWRFLLGDGLDYGLTSFNDSSWRLLNLPHDWSIEGKYDTKNPSGPQGGYMPCGIGWYRKHFVISERDKGKRFFIHFDGVYMKSQVWINDRMVGEYPNGYDSFEYDITPYVKVGQENLLAVKVDNYLQPSSRWYSGTGIYRDVSLIVTDQLHFINDGIFVTTPSVAKERATVKVHYEIINHAYPETKFAWTDKTSLFIWMKDQKGGSEQHVGKNIRVSKDCTIASALYDQNGELVKRTESVLTVGDFSERQWEQQMLIEKPHLWSDKTPYLYKLVSTIAYGGQVKDSVVTPVGIRQFTFSPQKGMQLNGESVKVNGVCIHQNMGCLGSATPIGAWRERLLRLKAMGCNAIRSHYPLFSPFQNMCDSLGILVSKEIFDEWDRGQEWGYSESPYGKLPYTYHLYFNQWAETDLRRMVRRDRNHPCVFLYQLGNELPNQRIKGVDIAKKLKAIIKSEDATRPVTAACDFFVGANASGFMDVLDIAGYNYIDRIHKDSLYLAEHVRYPNRVLLGTETYHSTRNHLSIRDTPSAIGEFVWIGYDYLGEIVWPGYRGWTAGMLDIAGFPKPEYYLRKSYWSTEPVVHIGIEARKERDFSWSPRPLDDNWNWEAKGDSLLPVYVYTNCDEVDLLLNGKSLGRKKVNRNDFMALWHLSYKKGTLKAIGYREGKKVAEHILRSAEEPSSIKVSRIYRYDDFVRVEVQIVDKKGVKVPNKDRRIQIGESSHLTVLGLDNGNQYDPLGEKYSSKESGKTFNGQMVIYVRLSGKMGGKMVLQSEGLKSCIVNVN
jgi:beta-galactosidase